MEAGAFLALIMVIEQADEVGHRTNCFRMLAHLRQGGSQAATTQGISRASQFGDQNRGSCGADASDSLFCVEWLGRIKNIEDGGHRGQGRWAHIAQMLQGAGGERRAIVEHGTCECINDSLIARANGGQRIEKNPAIKTVF